MEKTKQEELTAAKDMKTVLYKCENAEKELREALALARSHRKRLLTLDLKEAQSQLRLLMRSAEAAAEAHTKKAAKL